MTRLDGLLYFIRNRIWDLQRSKKTLYTFIGSVAGVLAVLALIIFVIVPAINYSRAVSYVNNGKYAEAAHLFKDLGNYRDSKEYARIYTLLAAEPGDHVFYGSYEQDNNLENGAEELEWIVLDTDGDKVLMITKDLVEPLAFSKGFDMATWDISGAREWCNGKFYETAFTDDERAAIKLNQFEAPINVRYDFMPAGEATEDYVFFLTLEDAERYFPEDETKYAYATPYAAANGALVHKETGYSWWWLRTVGANRMLACAVHASYQIVFNVADYYGCNVSNGEGCARPAIWVDSAVYAEKLHPTN